MEIGIITVVFGDYNKFIPQWYDSIKKLTVKPKQITIVAYDTEIEPIEGVQIIKINKTTQGHARNIGIENTNTDWIVYIDVDDRILPHAIE